MERRDLRVRRRKEGDLRDVEEVVVAGEVGDVVVRFRSRSNRSRFEVGVVEVGSSNHRGRSRSRASRK